MKLNNKPFWIAISVISMLVLQTLGVIPLQTASASSSGFIAPSTFSNSTLINAGYAFVSDDQYVQSSLTNSDNSKKSAVYGNFGFNIPAGSTINRIDVSIEGHGAHNWKVAVSKDNGVNYSAFDTIVNTANDTVTITSGPGTLWGLTDWTPDSLTNSNFRVRVTSGGSNDYNIAYLDQLRVRVIYSSSSAAPTTLVITTPPAGTYGDTITLRALLTSNGTPLSGKSIVFTVDGLSKSPPATTNASGVATLYNVNLTNDFTGMLLDAGHYVGGVGAIFEGDDNYAYSTDTEALKINRRPITITANPQAKVYGSDDPILTYQITSGSLVGDDDFSGALMRAIDENVGTHAITQGTLTLNANYILTYVGNNLTITPLDLTVTADNKSVHTGYPDPVFTFGTSRFVGSDTFITTPICNVPEAHTTVGQYVISCTGGDASPNYAITYVNGVLTVSDYFILTVTADDKTKTYGNADPSFTFSYSGFVDGDTQSVLNVPPTCSVPVPHTNVGTYNAITCEGGSDDKYDFSYVSGTLTVNPRPVTVSADAKNKTYGTLDPVLTYQITSGSLNGGDNFAGDLSRTVGENVGTYAILQGTLTLGGNYALTYTGNNLTVNKATLFVIADDQTKLPGNPDPSFTFVYEGFVHGEDETVINIAPTCGVSGPHATEGTYAIICSGGVDNNYSFSYVNGTLTVAYPAHTFDDVLTSHPYFSAIEILYANGYTGGCSTSPLLYCPDLVMNRAQAAVFMLRGNFGSGYVPVANPSHFFLDNWSGVTWAEGWAESMYLEGLTGGCSASPLMFCPQEQLTNVQAAVFALRLKHGMNYQPPAGSGTVFADLTDVNFWGLGWAEQAYAEGLLPSCGSSAGQPLFCPNALVSRGFGAQIIVQAKNLSMP